jgi:hypothetical protein
MRYQYRVRVAGYADNLKMDLYRGNVGGATGSDPGGDALHRSIPWTGLKYFDLPTMKFAHEELRNTTLLFLISGDLI